MRAVIIKPIVHDRERRSAPSVNMRSITKGLDGVRHALLGLFAYQVRTAIHDVRHGHYRHAGFASDIRQGGLWLGTPHMGTTIVNIGSSIHTGQ